VLGGVGGGGEGLRFVLQEGLNFGPVEEVGRFHQKVLVRNGGEFGPAVVGNVLELARNLVPILTGMAAAVLAAYPRQEP